MVNIVGVVPNQNVDQTGKPNNPNTDEYGNPIGSYGGGSLGYINPYQSEMAIGGEKAGRYTASIYYGSPEDIGSNAAYYRSRIKSAVDQPSGLANQMTQASNAQIARSNAAAGIGGVDTSARNIAEERQNLTQANAAQQTENRINLANYGKSIGAGISGTEALAAAGAGRGTAATPTPTPSYGGSTLPCFALVLVGLMSKETYASESSFVNVNSLEYIGYSIISYPITYFIFKSSLFAKIYSYFAHMYINEKLNKNNKAGKIIKNIGEPVCKLIGGVYVRIAKEKETIRTTWSK